MVQRTVEQRFREKINPNGPIPAHRPELGPCAVWTASIFKSLGYGKFQAGTSRATRREVYAHRFAWKLANGPIPNGKLICHHCDNPPCVKATADENGPAHLFLGTYADNNMDTAVKGRHGRNKITVEVARQIKKLLREGNGPVAVARLVGVSRYIVQDIGCGRTWRHA